jgi:C-terminal processing protease CtpA/Prc
MIRYRQTRLARVALFALTVAMLGAGAGAGTSLAGPVRNPAQAASPSASPAVQPPIASANPSATESAAPSESPAATATAEATVTPTVAPTQAPTEAPTVAPTQAPTEAPTVAPTETPAASASAEPSTSAEPSASAEPSTSGETGPTIVTGALTYTNVYFPLGVAEPEIILEDEGGFVTRDRSFVMPVESQTIGQLTSDFSTSPVSYSLSLPAEPQGTLHDVNHDGKDDTGVQVFAVAYWTNTWGDPYLERRDLDGGGWSSAYASTRVSSDPDNYLEWTGGKVLVYAPDGNQQFPSGFGDDKKLFTDDDPIMDLPQGWSVIDMDQAPFAIDRSADPTIDLIEPADTALADFSNLSYPDAFDAMVDRFKKLYPFTELKGIDWDAKSTQFREEFVQAQEANDSHAYQQAIQDFLFSIPDVHIGASLPALNDDFQSDTAGGLGFAITQLDSGQYVVSYLTAGGPAAKAGMKIDAQILSLDGQPIDKVVDANVPWSSPFSTDTAKHLQQMRYALRFPMDKKQVEVQFKNPKAEAKKATLAVVNEYDSFSASSFAAGTSATDLPVEFSILPDGLGYIKVTSFSDNEVLTIQLWERALSYLIQNQVPGVILDMRQNGGGDGWLADQMAAYFFKQDTPYGTSYMYGSPGNDVSMIPPPADLQFTGDVTVLVAPGCVSACEYFTRGLTIDSRASIVGQYGTAGGGGSVDIFSMPDSVQVQMPIGETLDADGNVVIEGVGIVPTVRVPVSPETVLQASRGQDVVLAAGEKELESETNTGK